MSRTSFANPALTMARALSDTVAGFDRKMLGRCLSSLADRSSRAPHVGCCSWHPRDWD